MTSGLNRPSGEPYSFTPDKCSVSDTEKAAQVKRVNAGGVEEDTSKAADR